MWLIRPQLRNYFLALEMHVVHVFRRNSRHRNENVKPAKYEYLYWFGFNPPTLSQSQAPISVPSRWHCSQVSNHSNSTCLPQKESAKCIYFTLAPRAISAAFRGQMQCMTPRQNINKQYAHRPVADSSKSSKHTAMMPLLKLALIQITFLLKTQIKISSAFLSICTQIPRLWSIKRCL